MDNWIRSLIGLGDYGITLYVVITVSIAGLLCFFIGLERQLRSEPAGVTIHVLLSIGCALLMALSIWAVGMADGSMSSTGEVGSILNYDTSRIAAGVVTGIGFLGGGVIIKEKFGIKGLSTAGTLWICSALGLACGAGFVAEAIIVTVIIFALLGVLRLINNDIERKWPSILVVSKKDYPLLSEIRTFASDNGLILKNAEIVSFDDDKMTAKLYFSFKTDSMQLQYVCEQLAKEKSVLSIEISSDNK